MTPSPLLAFVGDWNAQPGDRGRWSPSWLASAVGLRIHSAGKGRHGDIDYAMSESSAVDVGRRPPPGPARGASDHDVYRVKLGGLVVLSWNMRVGRSSTRAQTDLHELLRALPDVVALQEAADYHHAIRDVARLHAYHVLMSPEPGRWHNVLLVRGDRKVAAGRFVQLSPHGWRLVAGGRHAELWATSWLVDSWLRLVVVHLPPSVNWTKRGRIHGPVMRVAAYVATARKLRRWARNWRRRNG